MDNQESQYWFRAKRYGWGWGLPLRWQGWIFLIFWISAIVGLGPVFYHDRFYFAGFMVLMILLLLFVCYSKGEPPGWRWGERE